MHCIRLGSAWQLHRVPTAEKARPEDCSLKMTIDLPARGTLLGKCTSDAAFILRRTFHRPSNLDGVQCVKLAFSGLAGGARVVLNGLVLSPDASAELCDGVVRFAVQDKLLLRNQLGVEFLTCATIPSDRMILEAVSLEIESDVRGGG